MACTLENYFHDSIDDFNQSCCRSTNQVKGLRVLQWNTRGLNDLSKFDSLLQSIESFCVPVDVIVVSETWLKIENVSLYRIPGYVAVFSCRNSSSGGLAIYIKQGIKHRLVCNEAVDGMHHIHVEIELNKHCMDFHGIYRPPCFDFHRFNDMLERWLHNTNRNRSSFIAGDLNVPLNMANNNVVIKYRRLLESYDFICTNTFVTRPASNNILDHFVCKMDDAELVRNDTIFSDISDHFPILSSIRFKTNRAQQLVHKHIIDHTKLRNDFNCYINSIDTVSDAELTLSNITSTYHSMLSNCTKIVTKNFNVKNNLCPWLTYDAWFLMKLKSNYLKRVKNNPTDSHLKDMLKHVSGKLDRVKRNCKKRYYENLLKATCHSKFWKNINSIFGRSREDKQILLINDGRRTKSDQETCEVFNNYFTRIGHELANNISRNPRMSPYENVVSVSSSIFLQPSTVIEVVTLISELDSNKSSGYDGISAKLLKSNPLQFAKILSDVFNLIITNGQYPDSLKIAKVTPIFKTGDATIPSNYRPISTLSVFTKILEKLLVSRLIGFFDQNNVLYKMQYGFRRGCSTSTAIIELVDYVVSKLEAKDIVGALFLDLQKAFDTLNHNILLNKLERYGIRGIARSVIESYLSNRKQYVAIGNAKSSMKDINIGVPQGSNIGPLLFLIYINDLGSIALKGVPRLFADDTAIFYPNRSARSIIADIESDLILLNNYFSINLLSLNFIKTKYMIFHSINKRVELHDNPKIGRIRIGEVNEFKYLGIIFDSTLTWGSHINYVENKVSVLCGAMRRVSDFVSRKALLSFYYGCVHSLLQYVIAVWGNACKSRLKKLQVIQNRCVKIIYKLPFLYPTLNLYSNTSHGILPIRGMVDLQTCTFVHDIRFNTHKHHNLYLPVVSSTRSTRQANHLVRIRASTSLGQKRISVKGPILFNSLPSNLRSIENKSTFKAKLKHHFKSKVIDFI